ncbi:hypothetical protein WUBG_13040, partial [Wuchereria bancrofti]
LLHSSSLSTLSPLSPSSQSVDITVEECLQASDTCTYHLYALCMCPSVPFFPTSFISCTNRN